MAAGFDQAGVGFDDADYTFDGTFIGVSPTTGGLFLSVFLTARNIAAAQACNVTSNSASNTWSSQ